MPNPVRISPRQYWVLISLHMIGSAILFIPASLAQTSKQDAWMAGLLALALAILVLPLHRALGARFADTDLSLFVEKLLGRVVGSGVMLLFIAAVPFLLASLSLRNIGDFLTTQIMPETPIQAVHILFLSIVVMGVRLGLEPIARTAEIFLPLVIFLLVMLVILVTPEIRFERVTPMIENGILPVFRGGLTMLALPFLEAAFLIMMLPSVSNAKEGGRALRKGIVLGGSVLVLITALSILVHGAAITERQVFPSYILARKVNIGGIIDRIEIIVGIVWFITSYLRLTVLFYLTTTGLASTLRLRDHRCLTFPLALILLTLSIAVFPNSTWKFELVPVWSVYALVWGIVFPLLLLSLGAIRGKG